MKFFDLDDHFLVPEVVEDFARFDDSWVDDPVEDIKAVAAGNNEAVMAHQSEMLGEVRLRQIGDLKELFHRSFALFQDIQYFQAL